MGGKLNGSSICWMLMGPHQRNHRKPCRTQGMAFDLCQDESPKNRVGLYHYVRLRNYLWGKIETIGFPLDKQTNPNKNKKSSCEEIRRQTSTLPKTPSIAVSTPPRTKNHQQIFTKQKRQRSQRWRHKQQRPDPNRLLQPYTQDHHHKVLLVDCSLGVSVLSSPFAIIARFRSRSPASGITSIANLSFTLLRPVLIHPHNNEQAAALPPRRRRPAKRERWRMQLLLGEEVERDRDGGISPTCESALFLWNHRRCGGLPLHCQRRRRMSGIL